MKPTVDVKLSHPLSAAVRAALGIPAPPPIMYERTKVGPRFRSFL